MKKISKCIAFILTLIVFTSCSTSKDLSMELLADKDLIESSDSNNTSIEENKTDLWHGTYELKVGKPQTYIGISLCKYKEGKIKEIFSKDKINVSKGEKLSFDLKEDRLVVNRLDQKQAEKILEYEFEDPYKYTEVQGYVNNTSVNIEKGKEAVLFYTFYLESDNKDLPDIYNYDKLKKWIVKNKEASGMYVKIKFMPKA